LAIVSPVLIQSLKATPEDIKILSYSWYVYPDTASSSGDLIVVGEVQNVGSTTQKNVRIEGIPYTTDGQPQAYLVVNAFVDNLAPQQKAPFYMDFWAYNSNSGNMTWDTMVDRISLSVVYSNDSTTQPYSGLEVIANTSISSNPYTVVGIINNTGSHAVGQVWAETTFYNASGTVVAINYTDFLTNSFSPGETVSFQATPQDYTRLTSQITSYSFLVQSRAATPSPTTPAPSSTQTPSPSPITTPSSTPLNTAQPTKSPEVAQGTSFDIVYVIIAVLIAVIIVLSALVFRKSRK